MAPEEVWTAPALAKRPRKRTLHPPALDPTAPTDFAAAFSFLYSAPNPLQPGVTSGAIVSRHLAIVKGRIIDTSGTPLQKVHVMALHHPEYGETWTRKDGQFDLAV